MTSYRIFIAAVFSLALLIGSTTANDEDHWAVENLVHVHDLQSTMLHLMRFDHEELTYHHAGRDFRLTDGHGRVLHKLLA